MKKHMIVFAITSIVIVSGIGWVHRTLPYEYETVKDVLLGVSILALSGLLILERILTARYEKVFNWIAVLDFETFKKFFIERIQEGKSTEAQSLLFVYAERVSWEKLEETIAWIAQKAGKESGLIIDDMNTFFISTCIKQTQEILIRKYKEEMAKKPAETKFPPFPRITDWFKYGGNESIRPILDHIERSLNGNWKEEASLPIESNLMQIFEWILYWRYERCSIPNPIEEAIMNSSYTFTEILMEKLCRKTRTGPASGMTGEQMQRITSEILKNDKITKNLTELEFAKFKAIAEGQDYRNITRITKAMA